MDEKLLAPLLFDVSTTIAAHANGHTSLDELDDDGRAAVLEGARRVAEAMGPPEYLLERKDGAYVAESPLEEYPGRIVFPAPKGKVYTRLHETIRPQEGDPEIDPRGLFPYWRGVVTLCDLDVAGLDSLDFDETPGPVLVWASECLDEYYNRFFASGRSRNRRSRRA